MNALFYVDIDQGTQSWIFNVFFFYFQSIVAPDAPTAKSEDKPEVVPASNPIKDSTKSTTTGKNHAL